MGGEVRQNEARRDNAKGNQYITIAERETEGGGGITISKAAKLEKAMRKQQGKEGTRERWNGMYTYTPDAQIKLNTFLGKIPTKLFGVFGVDVLFFIIHYATLVCPRSAFTVFFFFFLLFLLSASLHCTSLRTISTGSSY